MTHKDDAIQTSMHLFSLSQLPILAILMSYFPPPEFHVFTANLLNTTTKEMHIDVESYSSAPLYLATSGVTALFAIASRRMELDENTRYTAEMMQEVSAWDMGFWVSMLFHHGLIIMFMCSPCDWYFLVLTTGGSTLLMMLLARLPLVDASRSRDYVLQFVAFGMIFMLYSAVRQHDHAGFFGGVLLMNGLVLIGHTFDQDPNMKVVGNSRLCYTSGMSVIMLGSFMC